MIVGRDFRLLDISPEAAGMLAPLCRTLAPGSLLSFTDPENAARFRALASTVAAGAGGPVLLRLVLEDGEEAVFGYLLAEEGLPEALRRRLDLPASARRGAVAFVAPSREAAGDATRMYRETFGLTPAEARLAAALRDGLALKEAAAKLNISVNTARNQIKSVFEKLGVNRQGDLIRHLTELSQLAAYMRAPGDASEGAAPVEPGEVPLSFAALPDGRRLAYRDYGLRGGIPVILLPSSVSSSWLWPAEAEAAKRAGLRYIVVERPGTGASTADPDLTFESFARDLEHFADALGLDRFRLTARSSASPFALACAAAASGRRVESSPVLPRRVSAFRKTPGKMRRSRSACLAPSSTISNAIPGCSIRRSSSCARRCRAISSGRSSTNSSNHRPPMSLSFAQRRRSRRR